MKPARYIYFTSNLPAMLTFYRDVLGMAVLHPPAAMDYPADQWVQLSSGNGFEVCLHHATKNGTERSRNKIAFIVENVAATRERLSGLGVKMGKHHVFTEFECCDFSDPDGNVLQISNR